MNEDNISVIIDSYTDFTECGAWGSVNTETNETTAGGKMFSRTVKVRHPNGSVGLEKEWVTDEDMNNEMRGKE